MDVGKEWCAWRGLWQRAEKGGGERARWQRKAGDLEESEWMGARAFYIRSHLCAASVPTGLYQAIHHSLFPFTRDSAKSWRR